MAMFNSYFDITRGYLLLERTIYGSDSTIRFGSLLRAIGTNRLAIAPDSSRCFCAGRLCLLRFRIACCANAGQGIKNGFTRENLRLTCRIVQIQYAVSFYIVVLHPSNVPVLGLTGFSQKPLHNRILVRVQKSREKVKVVSPF